MKKILYFDCETTGVDPRRNGIVQLACLMEIDNEIVEEKKFLMRPFPGDIVNPEAMAINNLTIDQIRSYADPKEIYQQIILFFERHIRKYDKNDKFYPAGFNVGFDLDFLSEYVKKVNADKFGIGSFCNWRRLDPLPLLYMLNFSGEINLPNFKLKTVCDYFGIQLDNAHDSLADIKATRDLIKVCFQMIKDVHII